MPRDRTPNTEYNFRNVWLEKQQFSWQYLHLYLHIEIVVTEPYCLLFTWFYSSEVQYQRCWIMPHVYFELFELFELPVISMFIFCIRCSLIYTSNRKLQCCRWQWYTNEQNTGQNDVYKFPYKNDMSSVLPFVIRKMFEMSNCHTFYDFEIWDFRCNFN